MTRTVFSELVTVSAMNPGWPAGLLAICGAVAGAACLLANVPDRAARTLGDPQTVLIQTATLGTTT